MVIYLICYTSLPGVPGGVLSMGSGGRVPDPHPEPGYLGAAVRTGVPADHLHPRRAAAMCWEWRPDPSQARPHACHFPAALQPVAVVCGDLWGEEDPDGDVAYGVLWQPGLGHHPAPLHPAHHLLPLPFQRVSLRDLDDRIHHEEAGCLKAHWASADCADYDMKSGERNYALAKMAYRMRCGNLLLNLHTNWLPTGRDLCGIYESITTWRDEVLSSGWIRFRLNYKMMATCSVLRYKRQCLCWICWARCMYCGLLVRNCCLSIGSQCSNHNLMENQVSLLRCKIFLPVSYMPWVRMVDHPHYPVCDHFYVCIVVALGECIQAMVSRSVQWTDAGNLRRLPLRESAFVIITATHIRSVVAHGDYVQAALRYVASGVDNGSADFHVGATHSICGWST